MLDVIHSPFRLHCKKQCGKWLGERSGVSQNQPGQPPMFFEGGLLLEPCPVTASLRDLRSASGSMWMYMETWLCGHMKAGLHPW